ncbi:MAG TPA: hypothetical protein VGM43_11805 [Bryobacteraceae bacterium]|jgi:lipopolysaccharide assembly outer membrane protein LptD (OstA)
MKLTLCASAVFLALTCLSQIAGQPAPGPLKHITTAPLNGARGGATLGAMSIEREVSYPSIVHLNGAVEIRTNGFILRADKADYDERTGEVEASGTVKVTPYPPLK